MALSDYDLDKYMREGGLGDVCTEKDLLPEGVVRVTKEAIAAKRLMDADPVRSDSGKIIIAAFDFDGTCLDGSSPKKLVNMLARKGRISLYKLFRVGLWGLAYKLNLPKDAEGVRKRVFSAFEGMPAKAVNKYLCQFYETKVSPIYRRDADAEMIAHLEAGHVVVLVSASFEPIIAAAMTEHPIQYALASRMQIDDAGKYTGEVEGLPTEGPDKIVVLKKFADEYFGEGKWELGWSYGDHYSDLEMLEAADHPCAVTPDGKLKDAAKERGWKILDWR